MKRDLINIIYTYSHFVTNHSNMAGNCQKDWFSFPVAILMTLFISHNLWVMSFSSFFPCMKDLAHNLDLYYLQSDSYCLQIICLPSFKFRDL